MAQYAYSYSTTGAPMMAGLSFTVFIIDLLIGLALSAFMFWAMFAKAGLPGWGSLIPIYNIYLLCKTGGKPGWWVILFFIPVVNLIIWIIVLLGIAKNFGHGGGFAVGLFFIPIIFFPILGFGSAQYQKPMMAAA